ncbi:CLUMA_CG012685, isoform A [Clunio marinus]|uniref:CLUMA_CG012685, isoform A n=1 Tax=Clunio marinus TaxID=568069 RepID=A0A1J1IGX5_9DIPT|nr:CLUMA_CG012685, isoform A [Clunio marinus]
MNYNFIPDYDSSKPRPPVPGKEDSRKFKMSDLSQIPDDIRQNIKRSQKDSSFILTPDLFDQMQKDVEQVINATTYPNFLQSDMYLQYVQTFHSAIDRSHNPASISASTTTTNSTTTSSFTFSDASSILLSRSSTLPTLHEEGEALNLEISEGAIGGFNDLNSNRVPTLSSSSSSSKVPMSLTKDALLATQMRRLEMRPPGLRGILYHEAKTANMPNVSYLPVSRRDSELASLSSGRTDSDTMSLSSLSNDGRSQRRYYRHHSSIQRAQIRENVGTNQAITIPRTEQLNLKKAYLSQDQFLEQLLPKLEKLKHDQDLREMMRKNFSEGEQARNHKLFADALSAKLMLGDDKDDQDILDQHVSRVWSDRTPHRSPGNISPCNQFQRRLPHDIAFGSTQSSMRTSKSLPDSNIRKFSKWGSINTDSGISLFSSDTMTMKYKDSMSISSSSSSSATKPQRTQMLPPEIIPSAGYSRMAQQLEDVRRSKGHLQQPPLPQKNVIPPPLPAKNFVQSSSSASSSLLQQNSTTITRAVPSAPEPTTTVIYSFCDGDLPYRTHIPGRQAPTLKQFKELMPKKGNYRFFFKTRCDDEDNPIIQEEICNDSDVLPLFEGKVMATLKLAN